MSNQSLIRLSNLSVHFRTTGGVVNAVSDVSLDIGHREIVGLVGESGSGKSTVGFSLIQLLPKPAGQIVGGSLYYKGRDLIKLSSKEIRAIRGCGIAMTFQDPMTYLNPVMRVGDQIAEAISQHQHISHREALRATAEWISRVRIQDPERISNSYPHQLSGGMRQRILIAMALACEPDLLVADEPTTALDVTVQKEILELLNSIRERFDTSILLISHDLGVISETCDRVYVMYAGRIFEYGDVYDVLMHPQNPYTQSLLRSARSIQEFNHSLYTIEGSTPSLVNPIEGCQFRERCPYTESRCNVEPPLHRLAAGGGSRCWRTLDEGNAIC
jgi:oligopeptide/dipeptide ABC transporter ATP-binding protein